MLAQTAGAATDHFVHGPAGVLSQRDSAGGWEWTLADGLGSVRSVAGSTNAVLETRAYDPYGQPLSSTGTPQTPTACPHVSGEYSDHCVAVIPPSRYSTWPVMKSDARDAMNRTACITSSGSATRPSGMRAVSEA
jgi:hypothetical protein